MSVNSKMTAIADAIRAKTGSGGTLTLDQMAAAIADIETGSGKTVTGVECKTSTSNGRLIGDINDDGIIDGTDEELAAELMANGDYDEAADLDGDGEVTTNDLRQLSSVISGLEEGQIIAKITVSFDDGTKSTYFAGVDAPEGGIDTSDATATAASILAPYTAYVDGEKITGTMEDNSGTRIHTAGGSSIIVSSGIRLAIPRNGYYSKNNLIFFSNESVANALGLTSDKIVKGNTFFGVTGTVDISGGSISDASAPTLNDKTFVWGSWTQEGDSSDGLTLPHNLGRTPTSCIVWAEPTSARSYGVVTMVYMGSFGLSGASYFNSGGTNAESAVGTYITCDSSIIELRLPNNTIFVDGWTYHIVVV